MKSPSPSRQAAVAALWRALVQSCRKSIKLAATQALRSRVAETPLRGKRMALVFVGETHALGFSSRRSSWSELYRAPPQRRVRCKSFASLADLALAKFASDLIRTF
jgi:hypothetical protein